MLRRIDGKNFCDYLALVNLFSFNFGFHVHEKAIMLVTIPLAVTLFQGMFSSDARERKESHIALARFKFMKLFLVWTFWPILYTMSDLLTRNLAAILDWILFAMVVRFQMKQVSGVKEVQSRRITLYNWMFTLLLASFLLTGRGFRNMVVHEWRKLVYGRHPLDQDP